MDPRFLFGGVISLDYYQCLCKFVDTKVETHNKVKIWIIINFQDLGKAVVPNLLNSRLDSGNKLTSYLLGANIH